MSNARNPRVEDGREAPWDDDFVARLARELHEVYRRRQARSGDVTAPAWNELPEAFRASNLDHARHIRTKLETAGYRAIADHAAAACDFEFSEAEVAILARMEHDRWVDERRDGRWMSGRYDPDRHTTPHLVTWEELSEEMREVDRMFVRAIPAVLATLGYRIVRTDARTDGA